MDFELGIILGGGLVVIVGLVVALVRQRVKRDSSPPRTSRRGAQSRRHATPPRDRAADSNPRASATARKLSDHERLAAEGKYEEAGRMAMRVRDFEAGLRYYLEANQPANAAHCARRAEHFERAADLYEQAGDLGAAAECWDLAGKPGRGRGARRSAVVRRQSDPQQPAALAPNPASSELEDQIAAAQNAEDFLRAAQLLEDSGDRERAASAWVEVARRAKDPTKYLDRIERLSETVCHRFLELETRARPLSRATAELHYQLALSFGRLDDANSARDTLKKISDTIGDYKATSVLLRDPSQLARTRTLPSARAMSDRPMELLADTRVLQARSGPSIEELSAMLDGKTCDLGNIEVFYRLGLAYLAEDRLEDASKAFAQVAEASPGYRDAERRLEHIKTKLDSG